jgi:hypothetical protein
MAQSQQQTIEAIKDTVQRWVDGKVDKAEFEAFLKTSNADLDKLTAEKERSEEFWRRYKSTMYY